MASTRGFTVQEDVVIGEAGSRALLGNLYTPSKPAQDRPALVVVHGGGWRKGSPRGVRGFGEHLSSVGFVCLCPAYRLSGEAHWPAQIEDVKCAIRYLRANSEKLDIDPYRIGVTGDSAGGHLALMAGVASDFEGTGGHSGHSSAVQAVGAMYGPVRIGTHRANGLKMDLMEPDSTSSDRSLASPIDYDLNDFPPCLLIHGTEDAAIPIAGTWELAQKLTHLDRHVELHSFAGEGHAFDRQSSTQEGMVDILDESSICGDVVIRIIEHFFKKYL